MAFLVGSMPRREGMLRKDLLTANAKIFRSQGKSLDKFAKKTVKVRGKDPIITLVMSWRSTISYISVLFSSLCQSQLSDRQSFCIASILHMYACTF